jgi:hypothetical protein
LTYEITDENGKLYKSHSCVYEEYEHDGKVIEDEDSVIIMQIQTLIRSIINPYNSCVSGVLFALLEDISICLDNDTETLIMCDVFKVFRSKLDEIEKKDHRASVVEKFLLDMENIKV